ncbi:sigma-54 interaction domain-containing protein [Desulfolutivibrio sp.]|uniref:sigma-54 interaction domain-containing protein n=1 Tax=Desulfolutivibrio sp. TaxID=2773296 RepID=UPI002F9624F5
MPQDGDDALSRENLARVLDDMGLGVFTVDEDWNIRLFNREAERITGYTRDEVLGKKCHEVFYTQNCHERCQLRQAIQTGRKIGKTRLDIRDKSGRRLAVEVSAAPLTDAAGAVVGGVETFLDVSGTNALPPAAARSHGLDEFVGADDAILRLFETLTLAAGTTAPILLLGETGTGKDLLARAAHSLSHRRDGPFVKINCAALPENLLESELFGYKKGAFTDARADKPGILQTAEGGTVFFDEIGELPLSLQAKLLQVMEEKRFRPLGATSLRTVDVRLVAATNRSLKTLAAEGKFRDDLYFRLRVLELEIPPLRKRRSDIPLLIEHFLKHIGEMYHKRIAGADPGVVKILYRHDFPGNVRELLHVVEHAVILAKDDVLHTGDLPPYLAQSAPRKAVADDPGPLARSERDCLVEELAAHGWNMAQTAKTLGVNRSTLWRKMKRYGL